MNPVAASATFCDTESFSAGRDRSLSPAATKAHLASGAQKKIVLGEGNVSSGQCTRKEEKQRGGKRTWVQRGGS